MQTLRYVRWKLAASAIVAAMGLFLLVFLFLEPEALAGSRRGRFFATSFGHYVFLPVLIGMTGCFVWRAAAMAMGTLEAISATSSALFVTGLWGRKRIPWHELVSICLESTGGQQQLAFRTRTGGLFGETAARVSIGLTEIHASRLDDFVDLILRTRDAAAPASARREAPLPTPGERIFDPDEAMARYLARKAGGEAETPASARPAPPLAEPAPRVAQRPTFGRKGV